jgi:hypothetical protein
MQDPDYPSSHIKHDRATKAEVALRREALFAIVSEMKPMTVRQVFQWVAPLGVDQCLASLRPVPGSHDD